MFVNANFHLYHGENKLSGSPICTRSARWFGFV